MAKEGNSVDSETGRECKKEKTGHGSDFSELKKYLDIHFE